MTEYISPFRDPDPLCLGMEENGYPYSDPTPFVFIAVRGAFGANGVVEGDLSGQQADIMGKVIGTISVKDLLQLKGNSHVKGNIQAAKLQIEPTANFNGQCHMNGNGHAGAGNGVVAEKKIDKVTAVAEAS